MYIYIYINIYTACLISIRNVPEPQNEQQQTCISPQTGAKANRQWSQLGWMLAHHRSRLSRWSFAWSSVCEWAFSLLAIWYLRPQEYNGPPFRRCDEWCAFGIAILLYIDKGVPVAHRPIKRSPSRHFRRGLIRNECWKTSNISIDRRR